jgi:hypothetical protein
VRVMCWYTLPGAHLTSIDVPHSFDGVFRIIREEGASALFRGVGPNCARAVLMNASQLAT